MDIERIRKLKAGQELRYRPQPDGPMLAATVLSNGPAGGELGDQLTIDLGDGLRITWDTENFAEGIAQLEEKS